MKENSQDEQKQIKLYHGAVTFLDVLGWKGIWRQNTSAISKLEGLISEINEQANKVTGKYIKKLRNDIKFKKYNKSSRNRGKMNDADLGKIADIKIEVLSISDTIVLLSPGDAKITLDMHAELVSWILKRALELELPLRGAISYGDYSYSNNIMLGYAVDEAASWHESTDWIGVILTPSAQIAKKDTKIPNIVPYKNIPFKKSIKNLIYCVDWHFDSDEDLEEIILAKGPHMPEVAPKYLNTLEFLNRDKDENKNTPPRLRTAELEK